MQGIEERTKTCIVELGADQGDSQERRLDPADKLSAALCDAVIVQVVGLKSLTRVVSEKLQSDRPHVHRRGTEQGDPLISLLFTWVLHQALES